MSRHPGGDCHPGWGELPNIYIYSLKILAHFLMFHGTSTMSWLDSPSSFSDNMTNIQKWGKSTILVDVLMYFLLTKWLMFTAMVVIRRSTSCLPCHQDIDRKLEQLEREEADNNKKTGGGGRWYRARCCFWGSRCVLSVIGSKLLLYIDAYKYADLSFLMSIKLICSSMSIDMSDRCVQTWR